MAKHHLIVAHEVTNNGIDRDQLMSMAKLARNEMGVEKLTAVADRGYYKSEGYSRVTKLALPYSFLRR
jgi:predicted N-acetyltransferase YhbS